MSQPFKLYRMQQFDTQLDACRARLEAIKEILNNNSALLAAQAEAQAAAAALEAGRKGLRQAEQEVQAQRVKIEQTEASLYGGKVHNPKELQDLQNEAAALKRFLAVLEDRQLDTMITVEDLEAKSAAAEAELEKVLSSLALEQASLHDEQASLEKDVIRLENERQAAQSGISAEEAQLYNQLRQQRRGVAVAKITGNACSACGSTLTPSLVQNARNAGALARCSFCGRILYAG